jgi:hypothetical protein
MLLYVRGNENDNLTSEDLKEGLYAALDKLGSRKKVLAIPPDFTRALGTHAPMTQDEIEQMFEGVPLGLFRRHNWRTDLVTLGEVPAEFVREVSEGRVNYGWPCPSVRSCRMK